MPEKEFTLPLHIYRASAGSGKTFLLASQYLCLLFEQPHKYREILAVTFTNKATEEMKHRILGELRKIAKGEKTDYGSIILERFPELAEGNQLAMKADQVYRAILHDYAKFSVSTIDSFVQQVIRSFAYEIGLDAGYELQMNQDIVKEDLADRLFELLETNDELLQWVQKIALERIENGQAWDFRGEMLNFAGEIFQERFHRFEANMRNLEDPTAAFESLKAGLQQTIRQMEEPMMEWAKKAQSILKASGLEPEVFSYAKSGFINYFNKVIQDKDFSPSKRVMEALDNLDRWTKKDTDESTRSRVAAIYPQYNELLNKAVDHVSEHMLTYQTAKVVLANLNNMNLLRIMAEQLADYRKENNALLISDTQQLLRELVSDNDAPFIYEKIGNRFQHFLLDEFQDTSSFQWDNFKPLVEQSVSTGQYNLIVGDVKQSIYRWRNGDWRLLQEQVKRDIGDVYVKEDSLKENYRSRKNIISFNNYLFHCAPKILQLDFNNEMSQVSDEAIHHRLQSNHYYDIIGTAYEDAAQEMPASAKDGGVVDIRFFAKDSRSIHSWRPEAEEWLCSLIDSLIVEKGIDPAQITLLTRNNKDARYLIDLLLQYQQTTKARARYGLISTDALVINASPAIQLLLAALKYLINDKDNLALVELVQANAYRLGLDLSNLEWYRIKTDHALAQLPEAFSKRRHYLLETGLYECVEELISIFSLDSWTREQAYVLAFRDMVNKFSVKGRADIREFLEWWADEGEKRALPMSSSANAIQVMTIHKSKGLAFDVVIVPYADWKLQNDQGRLWCQWKVEGSPIEVVPVSISKSLAQTHFAYDYFEEQLMARMDALNMLYVALTRTRQAMYIMAPMPSEKSEKEGSISTIGDLLYHSLKQSASSLPKGQEDYSANFESGKLCIDGEITGNGKGNASEDALVLQPFTAHPELLKDLREPARHELILQLSTNDQQKIGQLAHLALAKISHPDDAGTVLQKMQMEGIITSQYYEEVREKVMQAMNNQQLRLWFSEAYEAINERAILIKGGDTRRPDKVLVGKEETILLDFKFTQEESPGHARQLKQYQELLQQMGYPAVKSYVYYGFNQSLVPLAHLAVEQGNLFS
ncbi:UvrD-helicase domain-containing protein [Flavihumibacter rivuli]|uniref:UvrD-helicase domain-containing protein n=1 Tax=Flavihumibacter rivuli TaxID=2838156 RepID=UPI001BDEEBF4|nr:UvrD-helicase domain-containing protein [Flavihumibacter rivuli]ULQ55637.1 UvrD-helicase domain-containing protein [Flavihumibacter rivuli]